MGKAKLNAKAFADYLRAWLEKTNMTQNDLVRKMDISNAAMSQWLAEKTTPDSIIMLMKLSEATGVPFEKWFSLLTDKRYTAPVNTIDAAEKAMLEKQLKEVAAQLQEVQLRVGGAKPKRRLG